MLLLSERNSEQLKRCPDARVLLAEYVEGELPPLESRRIEGHLVICSACRLEEAQYRAAFTPMKSPRALASHGDLSAGLASKLARFEGRARVRQLQMRWAGACCLVLVMGGAGASFMKTYLSPAPRIDLPGQFAQASPLPRISPQSDMQKKAAPVPKPAMGPMFEWKNEGSQVTGNAGRDPFDPKSVEVVTTEPLKLDSPPSSTTFTASTVRRHSPRASKHASVAMSERDEFWQVQPRQGASAEEIILQKRREETVAQYSAPQPKEDPIPTRPILPDDRRPTAAPPIPEEHGVRDPGFPALEPGGTVPTITMLPEHDAEIEVNGKRTDIRTAMGYDRSGRPLLVKVNIGTKKMHRR